MQRTKNNYTVNATPTLQVLTEQQIEAIYYAALAVLSETGVRVYDKEGWDLAYQGGASVEDVQADNALVKMPSWMVDKARSTLPQRIRVIGPAGHDGVRKYKMDLFKNEIYYGTGSDTPFIAQLPCDCSFSAVSPSAARASAVSRICPPRASEASAAATSSRSAPVSRT